jgi:uncharacterized protein (TIGR03437 family)
MRTGSAAIFFGILAAFAPLASPNVIQVKASGTIRGTNLKTAFPDGQLVTVTFTFESGGLPQFTGGDTPGHPNERAGFYVDHVLSLSLVSGSYNSSYNAAPFGQLAKGIQSIAMDFRSNGSLSPFTNPKPQGIKLASVVDGGVTQTFVSGSFSLSSISPVWNDYNLPVTYNLPGLIYNTIVLYFSGGAFSATNGTVVVTDLTASRVPVVTSISPVNGFVGQPLTLTVNGSGFAAGDIVCWSPPLGTANCTSATTFVSPTQLTATIPAALNTVAGTGSVQVATALNVFSAPASAAITVFPAIDHFTYLRADGGSYSVNAGEPAFGLGVYGSGFTAGAVVQWNGSPRPTLGKGQVLLADISAADIAVAGTAQITVANPPPGGTSAPVSLIIGPAKPAANPVPAITSLAPSTVQARSGAFSLLVNGSGFVPNSLVQWNGTARPTSFVSATLLAASISANDVSTGGTRSVSVVTPAPGGGFTPAAAFTITNPAPVITSIAPAAGTAGGNGVTMAVNGQNFVSSSNVQWNGFSRGTTFVSPTQLTAVIASSDLLTAGTIPVTVVTPSPGGGASNAFGFSIGPATGGNGIPTITSVSPATAPAGSEGFTLTVNGTNFTIASVVRRNGVNRGTVYVNPTLLLAFVYSDDLLGTGADQISVFTPPPGGGASNLTSFTVGAAVANPLPAISVPLPSLVYSGVGGFTLTLAGSGFIPGCVIRWNGVDLITTFLSALSVSAVIPANLVTGNGNIDVVVFSPAPGGGISQTFTVRIVSAPATNPLPVVTSFFPGSWTAGALDFILQVSGTGFVPGSTVFINGRAHTATFVSDLLLWVNMTLADSALAGSLQVTVSNPLPGGGVSPALLFSVLAAPVINSGGINNAASLDPSQLSAAAGIGTLYGLNFSTGTLLTSSVPWPTTLGGLTLRINGVLSPLLYVTPQQLGFEFPAEVTGLTKVTAQVTLNGISSAVQTISLNPFSPGIFSMTQTGSGQGAVQSAGTTTLAAAPGSVPGQFCQPVPKSGFIAIYATGLGSVENPPANGAAGGADPLSRTVTQPTLTVGGIDAEVVFSGLAPYLVGVYQVNAKIPANAPSGNAVPLSMRIAGAVSNTVTIAIQ